MPREIRNLGQTALAEAEVELEQARDAVVARVGTLQVKLNEAVDWRRWFRRHPAALLATALGLGLLIGLRPGVHHVRRRS